VTARAGIQGFRQAPEIELIAQRC